MKDHTPGNFNRPSGYMSDLEVSESDIEAVRVNTSFGSGNHNAYIHNRSGTHEHYYYDPGKLRSGYHAENFNTRNNHPNLEMKGNENMKMLSQSEYNQMISEFKEYIGYDNLADNMQVQVDEKVDSIMASRGYSVQAEDSQCEVSIGDGSSSNVSSDEGGDDMQNRDEINDGHPYSLDSDIEMEASSSDGEENESAEADFEMEL